MAQKEYDALQKNNNSMNPNLSAGGSSPFPFDTKNITRGEALDPVDKDGNLRPETLKEFLGQDVIKKNLSTYIAASLARGDCLDHTLFVGPAGLGKTTLAQIISHEMGSGCVITSAMALDKVKDLVGILSNLTANSIFFIDEIHRLKPVVEEMLYIAMEDFEMDWVIGQGIAARTVRIPIPRFTLVGATTMAGRVSAPLRSRFGIIERFEYYKPLELTRVIKRTARILEIKIDDDAAEVLSCCCRGTPRVANRLVRRMRDFSQSANKKAVDKETVERGLKALGVDDLGLEKIDRDILSSIIDKFSGGPVGCDTLAISVGESSQTLEDYYEPYLIQLGLMQRTPRGRVATKKAYEHLGRYYGEREGAGLFS